MAGKLEKQEKEMENKTSKQLIQFIVFVLVIAAIAYAVYKFTAPADTHQYDKYNGYDFMYDEEQKLWFSTLQIEEQPFIIPFYFHPKDLEYIPVQKDIEDTLYQKKPKNVIITLPFNDTSSIVIAAIELSKITGERFKILEIPTSSAFNEYLQGFPLATCDNSSDDTLVINFEKSETSRIRSEGRCIILEYAQNESIKVADNLAYHILKIM